MKKKIKVILENTGLNLHWATRGLQYSDGEKAICYWDDVYVTLLDGEEEILKLFPTFECKKYIEFRIDDLKNGTGLKMEKKFPGYIEDELKTTPYNLSLQEVADRNDITVGFHYDDDLEHFKDSRLSSLKNIPSQMTDWGLPYDFCVCIPEETLTIENVEKGIRHLIENYSDYEIEEISWQNLLSEEEILKELDEQNKLIEHSREMAARGEKYTVVWHPQVLEVFFGKEFMKPYIDRGLQSAERVGDGDEYIFKFEDGHTEIVMMPD